MVGLVQIQLKIISQSSIYLSTVAKQLIYTLFFLNKLFLTSLSHSKQQSLTVRFFHNGWLVLAGKTPTGRNATITFTPAGFSWPAAQYSSTVVSEKLGFLNELAASHCVVPCSYFIFDDKLLTVDVSYKPKPRGSETVLNIIRRPKE